MEREMERQGAEYRNREEAHRDAVAAAQAAAGRARDDADRARDDLDRARRHLSAAEAQASTARAAGAAHEEEVAAAAERTDRALAAAHSAREEAAAAVVARDLAAGKAEDLTQRLALLRDHVASLDRQRSLPPPLSHTLTYAHTTDNGLSWWVGGRVGGVLGNMLEHAVIVNPHPNLSIPPHHTRERERDPQHPLDLERTAYLPGMVRGKG